MERYVTWSVAPAFCWKAPVNVSASSSRSLALARHTSPSTAASLAAAILTDLKHADAFEVSAKLPALVIGR